MKQLHELTMDELRLLAKNNQQWRTELIKKVYEEKMFLQSEDYKQMLGENNKCVAYHDHYSSFYLTIKDHDHFLDSIDRECLTTNGMALYDKAKELKDKWENMDYDEQDENSEVYDEMEKANEELLQEIESILHSYESVEDEDIEQELTLITESFSHMADWETDGEKVYQKITKTYK